jgi:hypothetical protein
MNFKKEVLFIAFFISMVQVYSQDINPMSIDSLNSQLKEPYLIGDVFFPKVGRGSQFFKDVWLPGDIKLVNNSMVFNKILNYDGFIDELIYSKLNSAAKVILDKELVSSFCLKDKESDSIYCFSKIKIKKEFYIDSCEIYAQILYANKLSLFAYRKVILDEPALVDKNGKDFYLDVFKPSPIYYFRLPAGKTIGFKRISRKTLLALFPENTDSVKKALKENKLRELKTEADLIRFTEILNSLTRY